MINEIIRNTIRFFILVFLQVFIIKNVSLGAYLVPMPYLIFLLMLPMNTPPILVLVLAFITGLGIDFFYDSQGIHAAACLILGFSRKYMLRFLSPREGYEVTMKPTVQSMGTGWFFYYSIPMIFIHHLFFFFLEEFGLNNTGLTLIKIISSTAITLLFVYVFQFLFYRKDGINS